MTHASQERIQTLLRPMLRDAPESPIRAMLALAGEPGMISLAGGHPDPMLLPRDWFIESAERALAKVRGADLQYIGTEGVASLRESICSLLLTRRISADPAAIMMTTGSQQGISLLLSAILEPGDAIAMAPFNYPSAIQAARLTGARLVTLDEGPAALDAVIAATMPARLKAVYLVPNFANPTGHVMSLESRLRLLETAARHDVCVIEDDPYGELWFERAPPDSLCALNQSWKIGASVAYLTSFSKILLPAFRLGVMFAPAPLQRGAVLVKQATDVHTSAVDQRFLDEMLRSGRLPQHLDQLRAAYRRKAQVMGDALAQTTHGLLSFERPGGGMFVWAECVGAAASSAQLDWFSFGRAHRVLALPGSAFSPTGAVHPRIRLSFANPSLEDIRVGVQRLAAGLTLELSGLATRASPGLPASVRYRIK